MSDIPKVYEFTPEQLYDLLSRVHEEGWDGHDSWDTESNEKDARMADFCHAMQNVMLYDLVTYIEYKKQRNVTLDRITELRREIAELEALLDE